MKNLILRYILGVLFSAILIVALTFYVSPKPGAMLVRHMFNSKFRVRDKQEFEKASSNVKVTYNHHYDSKFLDNSYDLYLPKKNTGKVPVLIWVHGGGYVGGGKSEVKEFATRLASDAQIAIISMNYERAPESHYPNQLVQVGDLLASLQKGTFSRLELNNIMLGGDSAGAQIALQYALTQTNIKYGASLKIPHLLEKGAIKATISYCGPLNLEQLKATKISSSIMKFFIRTVAWSELGTKNWENSQQLKEVSLVKHLTVDFPPTYITDGNTYSFQEQGVAFRERLKQLSVPVKSLFFNQSEKKVNHEYQFDYSSQEAKACYSQTLSFIEKNKK